VSGDPGQFPTAYSGPLRAQITEEVRSFNEKIRFDSGRPETSHTFEMEVNLRWEDHLRLTGFRAQPEVVEAVTDTGVRLASLSVAPNSWNVLAPNERQLTARLKLAPPLVGSHQLDRLSMRWGLVAVGDFASIAVDDLAARRTCRQDDVELTVESVERHEGGHLELALLVNRDGPLPEPQEILFQEYTVELFDGGGRALRLESQANLMTERGAQMRVTFNGDSQPDSPKTLRLTYPRLRDQREMQLVFRRVPLPTSRPE